MPAGLPPQPPPSGAPLVRLRLFAAARQAAGTDRAEMAGATVADVLGAACERYGPGFAEVLAGSRVWVDGEPATPAHRLDGGEEVAVLPPVSGG